MERIVKKLQLPLFNIFVLAMVVQLCGSLASGSSHEQERKAYIVYMGDSVETTISAVDRHHDLLSAAIGDEDIARKSRIHSYGKSLDAFAAHLMPQEAERLRENENVVSVFPSTLRKLQTTRSWDFLKMPLSVKRNSQIETDVIIGLLDTGIYVDAPSFDDKGFGPPPSKWKGICQSGGNFSGCNNKVIGARSYDVDRKNAVNNLSPADDEGHGTHTSSTIAGVPVQGASLYGLGQGTARGGVPGARIAMYKVCHERGCSDLDILAAFDDAIADGVDLLSVSIGGPSNDYFSDALAIGTFHAMKKGILTSCSAGNEGPRMSSVENVAPWILTVGASGLDRQFRSSARFGDGMRTSGVSLNTFRLKRRMYPLISGAKAANNSRIKDDFFSPMSCDSGTLDEKKVKGKIVFCHRGYDQDYVIKKLGGVGVILVKQGNLDTGSSFLIPATIVDPLEAEKIDKYINSTKNPRAIISKSRKVTVAAPFVASFSSRGPNPVSSTIAKPDLVAPGIDILAAYTKLASVTGSEDDNRYDVYNIMSGTSMACPHAAATAAYIKSFHPDWSPAAIKSALMTTATEMKVGEELAELAYGAGQIDPVRALHPGLVYDASKMNYIRFLCNEGYSGTVLRLITDEYINCSRIPSIGGNDALNYPSMYLQLENPNSSISAILHRTVTNVEPGNFIYKATVKAPKELKITVTPDTLKFDRMYEKKSFKVEIKGPALKINVTVLSASLEWRSDSSSHRVKSPIIIHAKELYY
ncbi:subtilisin-like protease SBT4.15 [Tripterygium wilfordii]|uniref:subtilisin-like protease SBT4.15 n=1 Tax=Tripterygium wilfordii TaxID=458696 RepID=UPI0018F85328|nr:subtilisin-like protease SBT4.15 [Tripterygium wilfordii]